MAPAQHGGDDAGMGGVSAVDRRVAVLGAGMHEWGKWGRPFVEYGVAAAHDALDDAGLSWRDVQYVSGADTIRNGYPGFIAGATFAQALGWTGVPVSSVYAACASGAVAIANARAQILAGLCDVALVVGADTTPKGFFAPVGGERKDDPDWLRFHLLGATNPTYFALYARRRMDRFGATEEDFAQVKVKNARHGLANPKARYRKEVTVDEVLASPMVADPLRLLEICATSDGGAALVLSSLEFARRHAGGASPLVTIGAVSTVTPRFPNTVIEMPNFSTDSAAAVPATASADAASDHGVTTVVGAGAGAGGFRPSIAAAAYAESGIGPEDLSLAEVYDLSSALELDWYEDIGLCGEGEAEKLLRDGVTALGGRVPVNPSGGLSCFGEAIPAQAIAQVCECVWQLRGQTAGRQVEGATVALTANQGLFGHGSSVVLSR
jgi:acetyl-CoA acetyltransferase